ncbi:hypothetical protein [Anaeromicropila populeti]|uniref:Uncharacterized protein n=1 Tax=Anaeromicropila populeti TaxID=37658 RepID=A0A1I6I611_9FIRM|nr:hypothetical protein [Anaeromicropila populeti]SFR62133.1 hypothetical protein SAMN05661086_00451 [Anaeromicropila populeti]
MRARKSFNNLDEELDFSQEEVRQQELYQRTLKYLSYEDSQNKGLTYVFLLMGFMLILILGIASSLPSGWAGSFIMVSEQTFNLVIYGCGVCVLVLEMGGPKAHGKRIVTYLAFVLIVPLAAILYSNLFQIEDVYVVEATFIALIAAYFIMALIIRCVKKDWTGNQLAGIMLGVLGAIFIILMVILYVNLDKVPYKFVSVFLLAHYITIMFGMKRVTNISEYFVGKSNLLVAFWGAKVLIVGPLCIFGYLVRLAIWRVMRYGDFFDYL